MSIRNGVRGFGEDTWGQADWGPEVYDETMAASAADTSSGGSSSAGDIIGSVIGGIGSVVGAIFGGTAQAATTAYDPSHYQYQQRPAPASFFSTATGKVVLWGGVAVAGVVLYKALAAGRGGSMAGYRKRHRRSRRRSR